MLDEVLEGKKTPTELSRVSFKINSAKVPTFALNDILIAHPCPASVSRFSFRFSYHFTGKFLTWLERLKGYNKLLSLYVESRKNAVKRHI